MPKSKNRSIPQKDVHQRLNYLYQAAHTVLTISPDNWELSQHYSSTLMVLAKRNVLRLHPQVKRTLCKICNMILIPGVTAKTRTGMKGEKHIVIHCLHCGTSKKFLSKKDFILWHDRPENIKEIIIIGPKAFEGQSPTNLSKCNARKDEASERKVEKGRKHDDGATSNREVTEHK